MSAALEQLQGKLAYRFTHAALLQAALTHPSRERGEKKPSDYERLEFLGDRVLALLMAEWLYELYPQAREGELAKRHAALVNRDVLAEIAATLDLAAALVLVNPEDLKRGRVNILSDAMEALIGAVYLDNEAHHNMEFLRGLLKVLWHPFATAAFETAQDAKSLLQEWAQARGYPLPEYKVIAQQGPAHAPRYTIEVHVKGEAPQVAEGASKREAEKKAAELMIKKLKGAGQV